NLLASSYRKAGGCFDAMESRCYNGKIRFLETAKMITPSDVTLFTVIIAGMLLSLLFQYMEVSLWVK
ncbi:MAG: hypothetical protein RR209_03650, partial [Angelakisella sp.]